MLIILSAIILTGYNLGCAVNNFSQVSKTKTSALVGGSYKKAAKIELRTVLNSPADIVWSKIKDDSLWVAMLKPKVILKQRDSLPEVVEQTMNSYDLSINRFIPFGKHHILWEKIDNETRVIQTRENGGFVQVWDNRIVVLELNDSTSILVDELILHGGFLTGLTAVWAKDVLKKRHKNIRNFFSIKQ